jgi:hypothetical protein
MRRWLVGILLALVAFVVLVFSGAWPFGMLRNESTMSPIAAFQLHRSLDLSSNLTIRWAKRDGDGLEWALCANHGPVRPTRAGERSWSSEAKDGGR